MKRKITPNTKMIIVNSPNNPTGYVYKKKEWEELAEIVIENDLYLLSDECYYKYVYDNNVHISPASLNGMEDRTITLNSISKTYSATGLRLGYVVANSDIITLMEKYHQYSVAGVNHPTQVGTVKAMQSKGLNFDKIRSAFVSRRDLSFNRLRGMGFEVSKPEGAFYIMPSIKKFGLSADEFSMKLIEKEGVAVVPGDIFGSYSDHRIRISYATDTGKLKTAYDRIEKFVSKL
jgi:aminotransferase